MRVEVFSRPDCCLCEEAKELLERVRRTVTFDLEIRDISGDAELVQKFGHEIPVVFIEGRKAFKGRVDEGKLLRRLGLR